VDRRPRPARRATDVDPLHYLRESLLHKEGLIDRTQGQIAELQSLLIRLQTEAAMLREEIARSRTPG
jgi:hypothetical protein